VVLRLLLAAISAALLASCEVYAVPNPPDCPGLSQGAFDFAASQVVSPGDCFFAQPSSSVYQVLPSFGFPGVIAFDASGDGAALCKSAAHAVPNVGTHAGDSIDVASVAALSVGGCTCPSPEAAAASGCLCAPNTPTTCSCPVGQEQRIQGSLLPIPGGYAGFDGTIVYTVTPPQLPPGTALCDCHVTCTYSYALAATVSGQR
jgi:hypothetical protein